MSPDCNHCDAVHEENVKMLAANHGCEVEIKYFNVDQTTDYKKLCDLEARYGVSHDSMPVVFIGEDSIGGEKECTDKIDSMIEKYSKTGAKWPDEVDLPKKDAMPSPNGSGSGTIGFGKTEIDLGRLDAGTVVKAEFPFKNTGNTILSIKALRTACGCFHSKSKAMKLQPGESSSVEVAFDTEALKGPFSKSVMVDSSDPAHPTMRLVIKAEIIPIAKIAPERWNFGTISPRSCIKQVIVITPTDPLGFAVTSGKSDGGRVSVTEMLSLPGKKKEYRVTLRVSAGDQPGRLYERITFNLKTSKGIRRLPFTVFGNVGQP